MTRNEAARARAWSNGVREETAEHRLAGMGLWEGAGGRELEASPVGL